jgi:hypothetical protein
VLLAKDLELGSADEPESLAKIANDFLAEHCDAGWSAVLLGVI